ncbi:hypothetical protein H4582DRAFT_2057012 [Lactarius indigo]|nr:hypothetical protein H4582DRAFT_2057012 [Lactarius indigo]
MTGANDYQNLQMDLQAQDCAHRIVPCRPSSSSAGARDREQDPSARIGEAPRYWSPLKAPIGNNAKTETRETIAEMAAQLLELGSEHRRDCPRRSALQLLKDDCDGAETHGRCRADADGELFEVYEAQADEGNDALAHILGEDASP